MLLDDNISSNATGHTMSSDRKALQINNSGLELIDGIGQLEYPIAGQNEAQTCDDDEKRYTESDLELLIERLNVWEQKNDRGPDK